MKPKLLIRIAAGFLAFFILGHSMGHFTRYDVTDAKEKQVLQVMRENKFNLFGHTTTYDGMYTGMSMDLIFTLITFTAILLMIAEINVSHYKLSFKLLLPVTLCIFGFAVTGYLYFFPIPAITCLIAGIVLTIALINLRSTANAESNSKEASLHNTKNTLHEV